MESVVARLPAASANVLRLVLEVCHYVAANAAETEMDALVRRAAGGGWPGWIEAPRS